MRRSILPLMALALAVSISGCGPATPEPSATGQPTEAPEATAPSTSTERPEPSDTPLPTPSPAPQRTEAQVVEVVDGDTIKVDVDGGVRDLRYIGMDAPEMNQPMGADARAANERLVGGRTVYLEKDVSETDPYGRLLRYVFLANGTFVNAKLVEQGYAQVSTYPPDVKYQDVLLERQEEAREEERGLWGPRPTPVPVTATPVPATAAAPTATSAASGEADVVVAPGCSQFDAPGNDNFTKDEEYVCFVNTGGGDADMSGWTLRDEYGWSYTFPDFVLPAGASVRVVTGCGTDTADALFWCHDDSAVWNNGGDIVFLYDRNNTLVARYDY